MSQELYPAHPGEYRMDHPVALPLELIKAQRGARESHDHWLKNAVDGELQRRHLLCKKAAAIIGGSATFQEIDDVIEQSNERQYLFHGIRTDDGFTKIRTEGIAPRTPEGRNGGSSFWTSGERLFVSETLGDHINTRDTSFFDYAHTRASDEHLLPMTLAITTAEHASKADAEFHFAKDGYLEIARPLPRDAVHIIRIERDTRGSDAQDSRKNAQQVEESLLHTLHHVLDHGFAPGSVTVVRI